MDRIDATYTMSFQDSHDAYAYIYEIRKELLSQFEKDVALSKETRDKLVQEKSELLFAHNVTINANSFDDILIQCNEEINNAKETLSTELKRLEDVENWVKKVYNSKAKFARNSQSIKNPVEWLKDKLEKFKNNFHFFDPIMARLGKTLDTLKEHINDSKEQKAEILNELEPELEYAKDINNFTKTNTFKEFLDGITRNAVDNIQFIKAKFYNIEKNNYEKKIVSCKDKYDKIDAKIKNEAIALKAIQQKRLDVINKYRYKAHKSPLQLKDIAKETGKIRQSHLAKLVKAKNMIILEMNQNICESQKITEKQINLIKNTHYDKNDLNIKKYEREGLAANLEFLTNNGLFVGENVTEDRIKALANLLTVSTLPNGDLNIKLVDAVIENDISVKDINLLTRAIDCDFVNPDLDVGNGYLDTNEIRKIIQAGMDNSSFIENLKNRNIQPSISDLANVNKGIIFAVNQMCLVDNIPNDIIEKVISGEIDLKNVKSIIIAATAAPNINESDKFIAKAKEDLDNPEVQEMDIINEFETIAKEKIEETQKETQKIEKTINDLQVKTDDDIAKEIVDKTQDEINIIATKELTNPAEPLTDIDGAEIPLAQYKFNMRDMHSMTEAIPDKSRKIFVSTTNAKATKFLEEKLAAQDIPHEVSYRNYAMDKAVKDIKSHEKKLDNQEISR